MWLLTSTDQGALDKNRCGLEANYEFIELIVKLNTRDYLFHICQI